MTLNNIGSESEESLADKIRGLLNKAKLRDKEYDASSYYERKYSLNPTVGIDKVREFEKKHTILLPEEYVYFLTQVGNGGAGPAHYDLYPLEKLEYYNDEYIANINKYPVFIDAKVDSITWEEFTKGARESHGDQYDEYIEKISAQVLVIASKGCCYDTILMLGGSEKGKIVDMDWEFNNPPDLTNKKFLEWYIEYFELVASGNFSAVNKYL